MRTGVIAGVMFATACGGGTGSVDAAFIDAAIDAAFIDAGIDAPLSSVAQQAYIKASNPDRGDGFTGTAGGSVGNKAALSADGSTLVVGALLERSNATGINGNQADNSLMDAGAAYVFVRAGSTWMQQAYLKASSSQARAYFGSAVAVSADGDTVAVSALGDAGTGAVYVFRRSGTTWTQQSRITGSNAESGDVFGWSMSISGDGSTLAVGATGEASLASGMGGTQTDNSAPESGAVYVFTRIGTAWTQQEYIKASNTGASDRFGWTLALSSDGSTLAVGARDEDSVVAGDQANNAATDAGAVYVFARSGIAWSQQAYLKASNIDAGDTFGASMALAADGLTLAVGALGERSGTSGINGNQSDNSVTLSGAVYVFTLSGAAWIQQAYVKGSNNDTVSGDQFGHSVSLSANGNRMVVGAVFEDSSSMGVNGSQTNNSAGTSGAAYLFLRAGAWGQAAYIKASNPEAFDTFGHSLALSADGSTFAVGASGEDSAASGINGNQADNAAMDSGACYVFAISGP